MHFFLAVVSLGLFVLPHILATELPSARDVSKAAGYMRAVSAVDATCTVGSQREPLSILADALIRHAGDATCTVGSHREPLSILADALIRHAGDATGESPLDAILHKIVHKRSKSEQPGVQVGILEDIRGGVQAAWRDVASALEGVRETVEDVANGAPRALEDALKALQGAFDGTEDAVERIDDAFARIDDAFVHADAGLAPCRCAPEEVEMLVRVVFELLGRPLDARASRMLRVMLRLGAGGVPSVVLAVSHMVSAVEG